MAMHKPSPQRFIEIDMLRGLAISLMVFGHILWDLSYFGLVPMNNVLYSALQKIVPPLFFLLVGVGLVVSKKKAESKPANDEKEYFKRLTLRGIKIVSLGMILSAFSFLIIPDKPVYFGVLHCIGFSMILSAPFLKYRNFNILAAILLLFSSQIIMNFSFSNPTILHLAFGLHPSDVWMHTVDYFPLMPWFGITLVGIVIGDWLYCGDKRVFRMPDLSKYRPVRVFQWAGQHSLGIYLIHQPIIAGALTLLILL